MLEVGAFALRTAWKIPEPKPKIKARVRHLRAGHKSRDRYNSRSLKATWPAHEKPVVRTMVLSPLCPAVAARRSSHLAEPPVTFRTSYGDSFQLSQYQPRRRIASENSEKLVGLAM